jgi:LacI family repressor for deo operon, udp, cdd, tsx, nupC, and nupG
MEEVRKSPTIQDVAQAARVSTATVSRALSMPEKVSKETRERVDAAVLATGYTVNQAARSLRKRSSQTILIALPNIGNPFFSKILDAIEREAARRCYGVLVGNRTPGRDSNRQLREYFLSSRADGLILLDGTVTLRDLGDITRLVSSAPIVIACEEIPGSPFPTVVTDNQDAARRATNYLIGLGHRRIAHIAGPENNILTSLRAAGYYAALREASITSGEEFVVHGDWGVESGASAARALLKLTPLPTAIFSGNDEMAIGFISEAQTMGFSCPADISVCGFDGIEISARVSPSLTTMRQPREEIGRHAAAALVDIIEGKTPAGPSRLVLKSELIERSSAMAQKDAVTA